MSRIYNHRLPGWTDAREVRRFFPRHLQGSGLVFFVSRIDTPTDEYPRYAGFCHGVSIDRLTFATEKGAALHACSILARKTETDVRRALLRELEKIGPDKSEDLFRVAA